jgi:hypothetical protein
LNLYSFAGTIVGAVVVLEGDSAMISPVNPDRIESDLESPWFCPRSIRQPPPARKTELQSVARPCISIGKSGYSLHKANALTNPLVDAPC